MDDVFFQDLPPALQQNDVGVEFGAIADNGADGSVIVCGSENEVANDLSLGNTGFSFFLNDDTDDVEARDLTEQKGQVWVNRVISVDDQLRQRMAWALNQLFAINPEDVGAREHTEGYLNYYDIFVKNAFGNYFDILKAISYRWVFSTYFTYSFVSVTNLLIFNSKMKSFHGRGEFKSLCKFSNTQMLL